MSRKKSTRSAIDATAILMDVVLLKQKVENIEVICGKLGSTLEKFQDMSITMTKLLSIHEEKINDISRDLVKHEEEQDKLHEQHKTEFTKDVDNLTSKFEELQKDIAKKFDDLTKTITDNLVIHATSQKWKWMMMGGGLVVITALQLFKPNVGSLWSLIEKFAN